MAITCPNFAGLLCTGDVTADAFCGDGTYFDGAHCVAATGRSNEGVTGNPLPVCKQDLWMGFFPTGCSLDAHVVTVDAVRHMCGEGTEVDPRTMKCKFVGFSDPDPAPGPAPGPAPDPTPDPTPDPAPAVPTCDADNELVDFYGESICVPKCYAFERNEDLTCKMQGDTCGQTEQGITKTYDESGNCVAVENTTNEQAVNTASTTPTLPGCGTDTIYDEDEQKCVCDPEVYTKDASSLFKMDNGNCVAYGECEAGFVRKADSNECWQKEKGNCLGWAYSSARYDTLSHAMTACDDDNDCKGVFFNESNYELRKNQCDQPQSILNRQSWMSGRCEPGRSDWNSGTYGEGYSGDGANHRGNNVFCDNHAVRKTYFKP